MASQKHAGAGAAITAAFGPWLRQLREEKRLAQRSIAAAADMDSSHYGKVESGKRLLTDEQAVAVADFLGVPRGDLRTRLVAARFMAVCDGDHTLAHSVAGLVQEAAAPYLVNNPAHKTASKLRTKK